MGVGGMGEGMGVNCTGPILIGATGGRLRSGSWGAGAGSGGGGTGAGAADCRPGAGSGGGGLGAV